MPFLAFLKSPKVIGMVVGGLALAALGLSWHLRGLKIDTLEARLNDCHNQRAALQANVNGLSEEISAQNAAISTLRDETVRRGALAAAAEERAQEASEAAQRRIAEIMAGRRTELGPEATDDEREIQACRDARLLLVR